MNSILLGCRKWQLFIYPIALKIERFGWLDCLLCIGGEAVWNYAFSLTGKADLADDIAQDVTQNIVVGKPNKYMWYFWGDIGVPNLALPNNDQNAMSPTTLMLPNTGLWNLEAFIDGHLFGEVRIKVMEK
jgi:hypothetical protein